MLAEIQDNMAQAKTTVSKAGNIQRVLLAYFKRKSNFKKGPSPLQNVLTYEENL